MTGLGSCLERLGGEPGRRRASQDSIQKGRPMDVQKIFCPEDTYFLERLEGMQAVYAAGEGIAREFRPRSICEIGVRAGYSAYAFIVGSGRVETYVGYDVDDRAMYGGPWLWWAEKLLDGFHGLEWEILEEDSQALTTLARNGVETQYDLIHVDGDHTREGCLHDMELAWPWVAPGGVMVVDDATSAEGPAGAVAEFSGKVEGAERMYLVVTTPHGAMVYVKSVTGGR